MLVIGEDSDIGFYRDLVRNMGVAEYVHKPLTRDNVARLFVPQIAGVTMDAGASRGGSVIAVCGARGGVGTTTVAVNLALQLSEATRGHVALLDLHLRQGTTALMLGVKPVRRAADCARAAGARGRTVPRSRCGGDQRTAATGRS